MIELFHEIKKQYQEHGDKLFIDEYSLSEGLYIKINSSFNIDKNDIVQVINNKEPIGTIDDYDWFKGRDFYSKMAYDDANKAIDSVEKKIHSINPFTLFFKRNTLPDKITNLAKNTAKKYEGQFLSGTDMFEIIVNRHFAIMENVFEIPDMINIHNYKTTILNLANEIVEICHEINIGEKARIKVYFDTDIELYKKIFLQYMKDKSFVSGKIDASTQKMLGKEVNKEEIFGALGFNNTLNKDKMTLLMNTTNFKTPYILSAEDSILFYKMSTVLNKLIPKFDYYVQINGKGELLNFDNIKIDNKQIQYINYKILGIKNPEDSVKEVITKSRKEIFNIFNSSFCENILYKVFRNIPVSDLIKTYKKTVTDLSILNEIISKKEIYENYFIKNHDNQISQSMIKITDKVIDYKIINSNLLKQNNIKKTINNRTKKDKADKNSIYVLRNLWDVQTSLINHFNEMEDYSNMADTIKEIYTTLKDNLISKKDELFTISNDEQFYFLTGQVAHYLVSQSKSNSKTGRLLEPFLKAKSYEKLLNEIEKHYEIYCHEINIYSKIPINKALQAIFGYTPDKSLNNSFIRHIFKAGLIGLNIFYIKKDIDNDAPK